MSENSKFAILIIDLSFAYAVIPLWVLAVAFWLYCSFIIISGILEEFYPQTYEACKFELEFQIKRLEERWRRHPQLVITLITLPTIGAIIIVSADLIWLDHMWRTIPHCFSSNHIGEWLWPVLSILTFVLYAFDVSSTLKSLAKDFIVQAYNYHGPDEDIIANLLFFGGVLCYMLSLIVSHFILFVYFMNIIWFLLNPLKFALSCMIFVCTGHIVRFTLC